MVSSAFAETVRNTIMNTPKIRQSFPVIYPPWKVFNVSEVQPHVKDFLFMLEKAMCNNYGYEKS
jgi:hypothetical protein